MKKMCTLGMCKCCPLGPPNFAEIQSLITVMSFTVAAFVTINVLRAPKS